MFPWTTYLDILTANQLPPGPYYAFPVCHVSYKRYFVSIETTRLCGKGDKVKGRQGIPGEDVGGGRVGGGGGGAYGRWEF